MYGCRIGGDEEKGNVKDEETTSTRAERLHWKWRTEMIMMVVIISQWPMFEQMKRDVFGIEPGYQLLVFFNAPL